MNAADSWAAWHRDDMKTVTDEVAEAYYETAYDLKDLRRDLASIKTAMQTMDSSNPLFAKEH